MITQNDHTRSSLSYKLHHTSFLSCTDTDHKTCSRSREFHFYGTNEELKFVDEEMLRDGALKEKAVLGALPQSHHDPAPFLA